MKPSLYSLKDWLSLDDAALHLSTVFAEPVTAADILQLGLQKKLRLSINLLAGASANLGHICDIGDALIILCPAGTPLAWLRGDERSGALDKKLRLLGEMRAKDIHKLDAEIRKAIDDQYVEVVFLGERLSESQVVEFDKRVQSVSGVYDLEIRSDDGLLIDEFLYSNCDVSLLDVSGVEGLWLERDGCIYRLCQSMASQADYEVFAKEEIFLKWKEECSRSSRRILTNQLPNEAIINVRRENLDAFIASLEVTGNAHNQSSEDEEKISQVFGALVELYVKNRGPEYTYRSRPNVSRIVEDLLVVTSDVSGMGERKLKEHVGAAIKAWEAMKHR